MDIFHTSDDHFGHTNIIAFCERPFDNADHMNEMLIQNWNSMVKPGDLVYHHGDLCMGKISETLKLIKRLNGKIVLIPGNHDKCWFGRSAGAALEQWRRAYIEAGIHEIIDTGAGHPEPVIDLGGVKAKMSHFPYVGDSHEKKYGDKYSAWRPDDEGGWLIHGHIHNAHGAGIRNGRMINVSVDVWDYAPVPIEWLTEMVHAA